MQMILKMQSGGATPLTIAAAAASAIVATPAPATCTGHRRLRHGCCCSHQQKLQHHEYNPEA